MVYYVENGKEYKVVRPEYNTYKTITKTSLSNKNVMEYEENNQVLKINKAVNYVLYTNWRSISYKIMILIILNLHMF